MKQFFLFKSGFFSTRAGIITFVLVFTVGLGLFATYIAPMITLPQQAIKTAVPTSQPFTQSPEVLPEQTPTGTEDPAPYLGILIENSDVTLSTGSVTNLII